MYAIVEIAGKQFKVRENDLVYVPRLDAEEQKSLTLDRVLLVSNDEDVKIGAPLVEGATVSATVVAHVKADKVLVFKKKRRKRFKVTKGHRQKYTQLKIDTLSLSAGKAKKKGKQAQSETSDVAVEAEA